MTRLAHRLASRVSGLLVVAELAAVFVVGLTAASVTDEEPGEPDVGTVAENDNTILIAGSCGDADLTREQAIAAARSSSMFGGDTRVSVRPPCPHGELWGTLSGEITGAIAVDPEHYRTVAAGCVEHAHGKRTELGRPLILGDADRTMIRRHVKHRLDAIAACYDRRADLLGAGGDLLISFMIASSGALSNVTGTGFDQELADCVAGVVRTVKLAATGDGQVTQVAYPINFRTVTR